MFDRRKFFHEYQMKFSSELKKALEGFTPDEQIHITDALLTIAGTYLEDPADYEKIKTVYEELLKKFRNRAENFHNSSVVEYLNEQSIMHLLLQDELKVENAGSEANFFTPEERQQFIKSVIKLLNLQKEMLYIFSAPEESGAELKGIPTEEKIIQEPSFSYTIQWTGKKDNRNEFVQLVYALHEAGYLNSGRGEITKITEKLADMLDVNLSDNWQSNLSKSIHISNADYEPAIFDAIKEAFINYSNRLRESKREKK